jgi:hypothetical protein
MSDIVALAALTKEAIDTGDMLKNFSAEVYRFLVQVARAACQYYSLQSQRGTIEDFSFYFGSFYFKVAEVTPGFERSAFRDEKKRVIPVFRFTLEIEQKYTTKNIFGLVSEHTGYKELASFAFHKDLDTHTYELFCSTKFNSITECSYSMEDIPYIRQFLTELKASIDNVEAYVSIK